MAEKEFGDVLPERSVPTAVFVSHQPSTNRFSPFHLSSRIIPPSVRLPFRNHACRLIPRRKSVSFCLCRLDPVLATVPLENRPLAPPKTKLSIDATPGVPADSRPPLWIPIHRLCPLATVMQDNSVVDKGSNSTERYYFLKNRHCIGPEGAACSAGPRSSINLEFGKFSLKVSIPYFQGSDSL